MTISVVSTGMGVQSTGLLVLAARGEIDYRTFLFANVGEDSEHPATLAYFRDVAIQYAAKHNIDLIELRKTRFGEEETLYQRLTRPGSRSIGIPVRMAGSGMPAQRACTKDFKIRVIDRWLREHGAKEEGAIVALGISLDEIERASDNKDTDTIAWKKNAFPLLTDVPKPLTRQDCINLIESEGLPIPPKSACFFCPHHNLQKWQEMRHQEPELFEKACNLEKSINAKRLAQGLDPVWFSRKLRPLAESTTELEQASLFDDIGCDSGYCWT